ncbi:MAG: chemotaxis protein CheA [Granulosicoccus sp.]|nr:chemotaxis protein CheA [Granulosicoccus sp.]
MDDDLEELRGIFLDECLENIELLERGLMAMGEGEGDADTLNEVFRAAHSIKGGGSTFGFLPMAEITHHMETLLDEMRSGRREVAEADVDLLLVALDLVQSMLADSREHGTADHDDRLNVQAQLEAAVVAGLSAGQDAPAESSEAAAAISQSGPELSHWRINFTPNPDFYLRGNDALLILRELKRLGEVNLSVNDQHLPEWSALDVNNSYLSWQIDLAGKVSEQDIKEVFEWVSTECAVDIESLKSTESEGSSEQTSNNETNESSSAQKSEQPDPSISQDSQKAAGPTSAGSSAQKKSTDAGTKKSNPDSGAKKAAAGKGGSANESSSIRIATDKIDQLINLVGELVITQSMLSRVCESTAGIDINELRERMADLEHNTRDLQESVMQVRMLPISSAFSRIPRLVRDLSRKLGKEVDLQMEGGSTELDKTVLERMIDPLVHLVRNGMDHGIETPEERKAADKSGVGILKLSARQESGSVIIEIEDDGKGINGPIILEKAREKGIVGADEELTPDQINQLIFAPGFSTAAVLSDVSGRGVGMDVVRRNILDLGGRVHVYSDCGVGTRIEINLPLSLAILDGQLVRVADQVYIIPILSIIETLELEQTERSDVPGTGEICRFRGEYLHMLRVADHFQLSAPSPGRLVVVVDTHGKRVGLVIDDVIGQQQVVIKPLDKNYKSVKGLAGATIMSDGSVALILDPANISEPEKARETDYMPEAA